MYGLYQSPGGVVEIKNSNSLEVALRELREETGLRIHQSNPNWIEQDKMEPWGIIPWDMYINMAVSRLLTSTHCTHTKMFLMEAGIIARGINVTFDDKVEELQYDLQDVPDELGINEDWKPRNQVTIDQRKKQLEQ